MNIGAPWPTPSEAEARVLWTQTKLHRWAGDDYGRRFNATAWTRGEPDAGRPARPVRRAGRGNGPSETAAPRRLVRPRRQTSSGSTSAPGRKAGSRARTPAGARDRRKRADGPRLHLSSSSYPEKTNQAARKRNPPTGPTRYTPSGWAWL